MSCTIDKIRAKQLELLCEIDRICEKNNLNYYLSSGTLIGAVRHKGYIPWDDDIDVIIPYRDYVKLRAIFSEENCTDSFFSDYTTERHCPFNWGKIRANNTISRPVMYKDLPIHWGICIDLFIAYNVSDFPLLRSFEILLFKVASKMLMAEMTQYEGKRSILKRFLEKIPIGLRHFAMKCAQWLLSLHHNKPTEYMFLVNRGGNLMKRSYIEGEKKKLVFETKEFYVPCDTHSFLTELYGDYMTPPPEEERGGHELMLGKIEWDILK